MKTKISLQAPDGDNTSDVADHVTDNHVDDSSVIEHASKLNVNVVKQNDIISYLFFRNWL